MSDKDLKSIKSRMGWQVGLQAATLASVGALNSSIKEQTNILGQKLEILQNETINGFESVAQAINSLEGTLLNGIEEIKWFLGSIDDKLGKIIGLIQYSKATESSEQFVIGMQLYKQDFFKEALKCFESSIEKNPLNLNAKTGLYLAKKQLKRKKEASSLSEIVKLTGSDYLFHMEATNEIRENTTNFFINFSFAELLEIGAYKDIKKLYEEEIESFSKEELPIKLKYINALVLSGADYSQYLDDILTEGHLEKLMLFFKYEKNNKHVIKFIKEATSMIKRRLPDEEAYCIREKPATQIEIKARYFKKMLYGDTKTLLEIGFYETSLSAKIKGIKTFFEAAVSAPLKMQNLKELSDTNKKNLNIIEEIKTPNFFNTTDLFAKDALAEIIEETKKQIKKYKAATEKKLKRELSFLNNNFASFSSKYPKLEQDSQDKYDIIIVFLNNIDESKKSINLEKIFMNKLLNKKEDE
tara:strand:- start:1373 stop:2782 length:1410 start_codon:yes stop_codon:yes gene_type:complete